MTKTSARPGVFISFEGGDGAGKSTQINRLADVLRAQGREVVVTREPGGSEGAEIIRKLLVEGDADRWSPLCEALLMYTSRADLLERTILPALKRGAVVITDRFADSSMAYQGIAGGLGENTLRKIHDIVVGDTDPDLTIILDLPVEAGLERAGARGGEARFESKGADFQERVRKAFLEIARREPERCVVVNANTGIEEVASAVNAAVRMRMPQLFGD